MIGYSLSDDLIERILSCRYHTKVFMLPPWKAIYKTDGERKQDWEEAQQTYKKMKNVYERFGYETIIVPTGNINERKEFVINCINE